MPDQHGASGNQQGGADDNFRVSSPQLSLPKGGGAIRGIGEKFAANPVTGTGSMTRADLPPARADPGLAHSFRSPTTPAPATARSASAGASRCRRSRARPTRGCRSIRMPKSRMSSFSPAPKIWCRFWSEREGDWVRDETLLAYVDGQELSHPALPPTHRGIVRAHRALDESSRSHGHLLALDLQRQHHHVVRQDDREPHRRSGRSRPHLQLADLRELRRQGQRSSSTSTRRKTPTAFDLAQAHERNRTDATRAANRYLKRIQYGNRHAVLARSCRLHLRRRCRAEWLFEVVFDYGEHDSDRTRRPTRRSAHVGRAPRSLLHLPRRLRGPHLSPLPARADVPPLSRAS